MALARFLPILEWGRSYNTATLTSDLNAAVIVTIMLIPQSLAYAMLAGLPPEIGLYASILPLVAYALFGTSRTLAVGPVAVVSLMTLTAAGRVAEPGSQAFIEAAVALATLSGGMLLVMGLLRLGFIANLLSHPVISGFISATGILIALGQLKGVMGYTEASPVHLPTLSIGIPTLAFLLWVRKGLKPLLTRAGLPNRPAELIARAGPIMAVAASTAAVVAFDLDAAGVRTVGAVPQALPPLGLPGFDAALWQSLLVPALLISTIGFVESVSVAQTLAARRRQRIQPDQELIGLGAANLASAASGAYPVTGGFARSVVNFDAGAETPAAGAYTAVGISLAALFLTPFLARLPVATLAATIIVAVLTLVDLKAPLRVWRYSQADFSAMAATIALTLLVSVEAGVTTGVVLSLALFLWRASRPHVAVVGQVPGTEHYRNVLRHQVITHPNILTLRIDDSLTYLNTRWVEEFLIEELAEHPEVQHVILMCSAVNAIDASALESLEAINQRLVDGGLQLHLTEVKGPVMDRLQDTHFLQALSGRVFLSQHQAVEALRQA